MRRCGGVVMAVVGVVAGLGIGAVPASSQPGQRTTIVALDLNRDDRSMEVDNNKQGFSAGDTFGFTSPLLDPEDRSKIGGLKALCTALTASRKNQVALQMCQGEATFPEGKVTFEGSLKFSPDTNTALFTVTGGTSTYEGAEGTVSLEFQRAGVTLTFDFTTE